MKRVGFLLLVMVGGLLPLVNTATATHDPNDFFVTEATFPGVTWSAIHGFSTTAAWAGSNAGVMAQRAGGVWTIQTYPYTTPIFDIWAASTTVAFAVGGITTGNIAKFDGGVWTTSLTAAGLGFSAVWGFSPIDVWALGSTSSGPNDPGNWQAYHYDGVSWNMCATCDFTDSPAIFQPSTIAGALFGTASNTLWASLWLGGTSVNKFWDGTAWGPSVPLAHQVNDMWGASSTDIWAVGGTSSVGQLSHYDGVAWTEIVQPLATPYAHNALYGTSASYVWMGSSAGGDILNLDFYDGTSWINHPATIAGDVRGVWCLDATNCWIVINDGTIQKLQINPAVAAPLVPVGMVHSDLAELETQNTNCVGAWAPFSITNDLAPATTIGDGDLYIYSRDAGVWVFQIDNALWTPAIPALPAAQAAWTSILLPPGDYYALLLLDITGVGAIDLFDADVFTVSASPCTDNPTDLGPVLNHIQYNQAQENATQLQLNHTDNNVTHIHAEQHNQHSITNARINTTFLSLYAQINANWARTNTTCQKTVFSIAGCEGLEILIGDVCQSGNCNFTVNNTPVLQALEAEKVRLLGFDSPETWTMLLFGALMVWALHKKWFFVAGVAMIGMISVILGTAGTWDSTGWTIAILILLVPAYWLELWMANRHQRHSDHDAAEGSA